MKKRSRRYPAKIIIDADYADDIAILADTPVQAAYSGKSSCWHLTPCQLSETNRQVHLPRKQCLINRKRQWHAAWTDINKLSVIWKSDLTDKMKHSFFQAAVVSILLYGCTTWTFTKRLQKKLDGNYTRLLRAILNKSRRQHPTKHQLYGHLTPTTKTIKVGRTRHAGHCWRSRDELISDVLLWTPHMAKQKQDDQLKPT